jgi:hypothetical protein
VLDYVVHRPSATTGGKHVDDIFARIVSGLWDRLNGPLSFRLVIQPVVAAVLAIRAGVADGHAGRRPYFWAVLLTPGQRRDLLREGWKAIATVFMLAVLIDIVYQFIVFRSIYPLDAVLMGFLLACVPYVAVRGVTARVTRLAWRPRVRS